MRPALPSDRFLHLLEPAFSRLAEGFAGLPLAPGPPQDLSASDSGRAAAVLDEVAARLADNYPYFHPLYAGQMLKPPHPVAQAAYALAMSINPNNHARDGGRASSEMEIEAVAQLAALFGWANAEQPQASSGFLGHLTSSGTIANLEALWIAGQLAPGKRILAQEHAHYTHQRISAVLQLPFSKLPADASGRIDLNALEDELRKGDVGTVVATIGTTAIGAVDPLPEILALKARYGFRLHLDAAYGGYFRLIQDSLAPETAAAYAAMDQADSIVVDPHKHGLQPYGCGCVLFRDPAVGRFYKHDSPYTYFTSAELHLGEISLECSRAGAAAVALWATQRLLPLTPHGEFASGLRASRAAALELHRRLGSDPRYLPSARTPDLDIVVWQIADPHPQAAAQKAQQIFDACARLHLHLALVQLPGAIFRSSTLQQNVQLTCLRSVLMKPEHAAWMNAIWDRLSKAADLILEAPK